MLNFLARLIDANNGLGCKAKIELKGSEPFPSKFPFFAPLTGT